MFISPVVDGNQCQVYLSMSSLLVTKNGQNFTNVMVISSILAGNR